MEVFLTLLSQTYTYSFPKFYFNTIFFKSAYITVLVIMFMIFEKTTKNISSKCYLAPTCCLSTVFRTMITRYDLSLFLNLQQSLKEDICSAEEEPLLWFTFPAQYHCLESITLQWEKITLNRNPFQQLCVHGWTDSTRSAWG